MRVITNGIDEIYKIYRMSENVQNKIYIGKTKLPIYAN